MSSAPQFSVVSSKDFTQAVTSYMTETYLWMMIGVFVTAIVALGFDLTQDVLSVSFSKSGLIGLSLAQFFYGLFLSRQISQMNPTVARGAFALYAGVMGVLLSYVLARYAPSAVLSVFATAVLTFAGASLYGIVTRKDLTAMGTFCVLALCGLIASSVVEIIFPSFFGGQVSYLLNIVAILVISGLTAYESQTIKNIAIENASGPSKGMIDPVVGAFSLYLSFIVIFLRLLRVGRRR